MPKFDRPFRFSATTKQLVHRQADVARDLGRATTPREA
jgi:hypothetical protein